jgi:hypothetical protein
MLDAWFASFQYEFTVTVAVARAAYTTFLVDEPVSAAASSLDEYRPTFPHHSESVVVMFVIRMYRTSSGTGCTVVATVVHMSPLTAPLGAVTLA